MEVQVLKSHGNKSRGKNDKGPQDMDVDCIKNVTANLSSKGAIDEVSHEHFRGFPVEIDLEGPQDGDEEDSGYVPTPEHEREELMPEGSGDRKEVIPADPGSDFSEEFEEPQLLGNLLLFFFAA